ncbi:hypothetical protein SAMN05216323_101538 [Williamwhitmania taraxaci]|uniref:Uncharacterized protein n=1 Tax=Williamwhitmania taraxaci TaxID=1640674 RepID=A0A1G6IBP6_9BACT|nr:hypothetical protein SAMN05216323_101538 [Williamwhitmania taraxaci]
MSIVKEPMPFDILTVFYEPLIEFLRYFLYFCAVNNFPDKWTIIIRKVLS